MSDRSPFSDPYGYIGIVLNPDGSVTRQHTRFQIAAATPDPSPYTPVISNDVTVSESKSLRIRFYLPSSAAGTTEKLPLVVYFHGGGFVLGSIDTDIIHNFCANMARDLNAMVASASYRLAPEHRLPSAYEDCVEALHWIRSSDDIWLKTHADISNVFVMGTSAGGNLAYVAGLRAAVTDLEPLRIRGLVLHHPFFGGVERKRSEIRLEKDNVLPPIVSDLFWDLSLPAGVDRDHEYSNPTVGDGPGKMEEMARRRLKVIVIGCEGDPLIDRQREVTELMKKKGVDAVGHFTDGDCHGVEIMDAEKAKSLFVLIKDFISSSMTMA